jgi:uncharacterized membrane protein
VKRFRLWNYLSSSLWFVPILCVLAGVALSFGTIAIDRAWGEGLVPGSLSAADPDAALAILSTVAISMVTLTGLVLTITMVVVQLAMGQFSPRVLRTVLRDRPSQFAIGVFVATFAHAMLVMREVRASSGGDEEGFVPSLAILVAFVLVLIGVMVLVSYVHHIGQSLRVASIIESVGGETRKLIAKMYPPARDTPETQPDEPTGRPQRTIEAPESGVLFRIGDDELVEAASDVDVRLLLLTKLGDFVPKGTPVLAVYGRDPSLGDEELLRCLAFGKERTLDEDVAYGIRLLVDVAVRSLSIGMSDPTTAVQAIDRIHDCLRQLVTRPFPSGQYRDESGRLRLIVPVLSWDGYVELAVEEIRHLAAGSVQVTRRLRGMLEDLMTVAPSERRSALERQLSLLEDLARRSFEAGEEREAALRPDQQGIGSGRDVLVKRDLEDSRGAAARTVSKADL